MSKPAKSAAEMPFEEALHKLEKIVEELEGEDLPLEKLLARFEEGTKLAKLCQEKMSEAELKIAQLEKSVAGEFKVKPLTVLGEEA
ncbi:MAG: exodeoxyribonuclease VII small subunit [Pedosphaera sp.]|nr:exodeoxyribonuclease VII small subunit [Pedosphaera sp.]